MFIVDKLWNIPSTISACAPLTAAFMSIMMQLNLFYFSFSSCVCECLAPRPALTLVKNLSRMTDACCRTWLPRLWGGGAVQTRHQEVACRQRGLADGNDEVAGALLLYLVASSLAFIPRRKLRVDLGFWDLRFGGGGVVVEHFLFANYGKEAASRDHFCPKHAPLFICYNAFDGAVWPSIFSNSDNYRRCLPCGDFF